MITLPFAEFPFFSKDITLDGASYRFQFLWNERATRWSLSIYDLSDVALVEGIAVTLNQELLGQYAWTGIPKGQLYAIDASDSIQVIGRDDILNELVSLVYVPVAEI